MTINASEFLELLYGGTTGERWLNIWTDHNLQSSWFRAPGQLEAAALKAMTLSAEGHNAYWQLGLQAKAMGANGRGTEKTAVSIPGIWVDLDVLHAAHDKKNLPPTFEAGLALLDEMPLPASVVISSGHGMYGLWLFHEPWEFDREREWEQAKGLVQAWQRALRQRARTRRWDVDATHDLTRLLRVPGTVNYKPDARTGEPLPPVESFVLRLTDARYTVEDIEFHVPSLDHIGATERFAPVELRGDFAPSAIESTDKFRVMYDEDHRFKASWNHERTDLQDQSMSSYDMSIAALLANSGGDWSDDEIASALVAHRLRWGGERKLSRRDYLEVTIGKARARAERARQAAEIDQAELGEIAVLAPHERVAQAAEYWARNLNVPDCQGWYVIRGERDAFRLVTLTRELFFTTDQIGSWREARKLLNVMLGIVLPKGNDEQWMRHVAKLVGLATVQGDPKPDSRKEVIGWLRDYIATHKPPVETDIDSREEWLSSADGWGGGGGSGSGGLILYNGLVTLRPKLLLEYLQQHLGEDIRSSELRKKWLVAGGVVGVQVRTTKGKLYCWAIDAERDLEAE